MAGGNPTREFELHARGKEGRAFEEARDHRIGAIGGESAQPFGDAWVLFGKFTRLLVKQLELTVVMIEKFLVHVYADLNKILPLSNSTSAMNSTGTLTGWHMSSALTTKRILSSALSSPVSRETSIVPAMALVQRAEAGHIPLAFGGSEPGC
jgi:hypothetical protein